MKENEHDITYHQTPINSKTHSECFSARVEKWNIYTHVLRSSWFSCSLFHFISLVFFFLLLVQTTESLFYVSNLSKNPKLTHVTFIWRWKNVCTSCSINIINENHLFIFRFMKFLKQFQTGYLSRLKLDPFPLDSDFDSFSLSLSLGSFHWNKHFCQLLNFYFISRAKEGKDVATGRAWNWEKDFWVISWAGIS